jgi:hypothetical protein
MPALSVEIYMEKYAIRVVLVEVGEGDFRPTGALLYGVYAAGLAIEQVSNGETPGPGRSPRQ